MYWGQPQDLVNLLYEIFATAYRNFIIKPFLNRIIRKFIKKGSKLLHAGCGSGQVDQGLRYWLKITAVDLSANAVKQYQQINYPYADAVIGDIRNLSFAEESFDALYNLGVMEHFTDSEIELSMKEFHRILKVNGLAILFWPHSNSPMRLILRLFSLVFNKKKDDLIPPEINRLKSKEQIETIAKSAGFKLEYYYFGLRDFYTQSVVVLKKV